MCRNRFEIIKSNDFSVLHIRIEKSANLTKNKLELEIETIFRRTRGRPATGVDLWLDNEIPNILISQKVVRLEI